MAEILEQQVDEQVQVDPPKSKKLWKALNDAKFYTKDYDSFSEQFSSPEKINALYTKLSESKFYTKSEEDFNNQFFTEPRVEPETKAIPEEPTTIINAPEDDDIASAESEADEADDLLEELKVVPKADEFHIVPDPDLPEPGIVEQDVTLIPKQPIKLTEEQLIEAKDAQKVREEMAKEDSSVKSLLKAAKQTALYTAPAAIIDAFVAETRSMEGSIKHLGVLKGKDDKRVENINEESAQRLKQAYEESGDKRAELEKQLDSVNTTIEASTKSGAIDDPAFEQRKQEIFAKKDKLTSELGQIQEAEQSQLEAFNAYMAPVLEETSRAGKALVGFTQKWTELGQKEIGADLKMTTDDVRGIADFVDYVASNVGQSIPYSAAAMVAGPMAMIRVEQGSIMGDMYRSMMEEEGLTLDEVFDKNIDAKAADIALEEGIKAGTLESVGEAITLLAPWAKFGLKAGTTITKSQFSKLLSKAGQASKRLLVAATGEGITENRQTKIELAAVLKNSGYTESEIEELIGWDELKEATFAGFFASAGTSMPSTAVRAYVDIVREKREKDVSKEKLVEPVEAKEEVIEEEVKPEDIAEAPVEEIKEELKEAEDVTIQEREAEEIPVGKPAEVSEEVGEKVPIEKEKDIKPDVEKKVEEKPITKKEELEKKIEKTETSKKSEYIKRRIKDVKDTPVFKKEVESLGDYTPHDQELAVSVSEKEISDFQSEYGEQEGLKEAFKLLKNKDIPELMIRPFSTELWTKMKSLGMESEAISVIDYKQKTLRESARTITPEKSTKSIVFDLFSEKEKKKTEALGEELKEGKTYGQAFEDIKKRLSEVETAYKELKEKGTIKEGELPEITDKKVKSKRSKELKIRGKALRKEGFAQLDKYFKTQRGTLSMGMRVDSDLISGLAKVFRGYLLEFEGNTLAAFEKFKSDTSKKYDVTKEALDSFKKNILEQSEETINEFKQEKQQQIVENILRPEGKETNEERKARKETSKEIVEAYNEGKPDAEVLDLFSGIAGFEKITEQDTKEILDLMEKQSQLLSEGKKILAYIKWVDLMFKLGDVGLLKRAKTDVIQDIWYTWVLSGLTTIARSIKGSGVSDAMFVTTRLIANPKVAPFALAQMIRGARGNTKAYWHVLKTGQTEFNMTDFDPKLPQFTSEITNRPFKELTNAKKIAKVLASPIIYAFRNIPAFDQVIGNIASEGNIAVAEFSRTDRGKKTAERLKDLKKALAENRREEIRNLVDAEIEDMKSSGETIPIGYKERRFREVRNEFRDRDAVKRALDDSRIGAFVSTPKGALGFVYNAWINAVEVKKDDPNAVKAGKLMLKGVFPFIRVSFNWLNAGLEYTPAGLIRAGFKQSRWTKDGIEKMTDYEKRELIARSIIGMAVGTSILNSMFDWDEEEGFTVKDEEDMWIQVHGPLTGKWYETEGVNKGAKPWSFRFKLPDGEWSDYYLYRDNPIGHMLAPIGIMHDELRIAKFQKDLGKKESEITFDKMDMNYLLGAWVNGTFQYASDQSFNQGMKSLSGLFLKSERKTAGEKLGELVTRPAEALINPALYKQTYNYFKAYQDIPEKQDRSWLEHAYKGIPIVDGLIKEDAYDVFGYPIVRSFDVPGIPDFILEMAKENLSYREELKEWKLLWKYEEVVLGGFLAPDKYKGYVLTSEDKDEFMKNAGEDMRERVNGNYERLNEMDAKELQIRLNSYKRKSKNKALKDINK